MTKTITKNKLNLGKLGLGIEHFARGVWQVKHLTREDNSIQILEAAYQSGITHYDLVYNLPYFFDVFRQFINDKRDKITFTTHFGSVYSEKGPDHKKSRSLKSIQETFEGMLEKLEVDFADIGLIQFVTHEEDFQKTKKNGILDYMNKLKDEGLIKVTGISAHKPELLMEILESDNFDIIMLPINFATGILPETKNLIEKCNSDGIHVIAIKNLMKAKVFSTKKTNYPAYFCGNKKLTMKLEEPATPGMCMKYAFDLGVDTVVFGVKTVEELKENINSYNNIHDNIDYSKIVKEFEKAIL